MSEFVNAEKAKTLDLTAYNGRTGTIKMDALTVGVRVKEARVRFGHIDLLVTPVNGWGEKWIESRRVSVDPKE